MNKNINQQEIGKQFISEKKLSKKQKIITAVLASTLLANISCSSPKEKYESGEISTEINNNKNTSKTLIDAYNNYCDIYEQGQKNLTELSSSGDIEGYQAEYNRLIELHETIKDLEEQIDDLRDTAFKLEEEYQEGKALSNENSENALPILKRRTFIEHQK